MNWTHFAKRWLRREWRRFKYVRVVGEGGHLECDARWYTESEEWTRTMEALANLRLVIETRAAK